MPNHGSDLFSPAADAFWIVGMVVNTGVGRRHIYTNFALSQLSTVCAACSMPISWFAGRSSHVQVKPPVLLCSLLGILAHISK